MRNTMWKVGGTNSDKRVYIELHGIHLLAYYMADLVSLSQETFSRFCEIHWDHLHISLDFLKDMTKIILTTVAQCD